MTERYTIFSETGDEYRLQFTTDRSNIIADIGANNAEACNAITKSDFKSKSYIALKEARESLYWIELLHRNSYIDDRQYYLVLF